MEKDTMFKEGDHVYVVRKGPHYHEIAQIEQVEEGADGEIYYTVSFPITVGRGKSKHTRYEFATGFTSTAFVKY